MTTTTSMQPSDDLRDAHVTLDARPKSGAMRAATWIILGALALALVAGILLLMFPVMFTAEQ